jgi:hypothetical protein
MKALEKQLLNKGFKNENKERFEHQTRTTEKEVSYSRTR